MTVRFRVSDSTRVPSVRIPSYAMSQLGQDISGQEYSWSTTYAYSKFPDVVSTMEDVVGDPGHFHPVKQRTLKSWLQPLQSFSDHVGSIVVWTNHLGTGITTRKPMDGLYLPLTLANQDSFLDRWPWFPPVSSANLSDWSIEAFNKFHDQVPTSVSLANSLYELKDMKGMIPSIDRLSVSKTLGNNFLAFEFGVLPFVSDIKAIVAMSDLVDKRLKHLIEVNGKATNLSFDRDIDCHNDIPYEFGVNLAEPYNMTLATNTNHIKFKRTSARGRFHCGAKLFQDLNDLRDAMAKMKGLAASGGFNHPARVVWNAIPYSFVVDWFFHVGKLLDSLTIQPFGGEYSVSDVGYSLKLEANFVVIQEMANGQIVLGNPLLGTVSAKSYERKIGFPASSLFLTDGMLSPTQVVLGLAMLNQRR